MRLMKNSSSFYNKNNSFETNQQTLDRKNIQGRMQQKINQK